jgi:hypothetical protein
VSWKSMPLKRHGGGRGKNGFFGKCILWSCEQTWHSLNLIKWTWGSLHNCSYIYSILLAIQQPNIIDCWLQANSSLLSDKLSRS